MAAPMTGDEEIVAALAEALDNLATGLWMGPGWGRLVADDLLALPALRDVLAAAARDAEKVRLREFAEWVLSLTDDPPHRRTVTLEQIVQRAALACDPDLDDPS